MGENMKKQKTYINYDNKKDVLFLSIREGVEEEYIEIAPGVNVEVDERGEVIGIEILNASKMLKPVAKSLIPRLEINN